MTRFWANDGFRHFVNDLLAGPSTYSAHIMTSYDAIIGAWNFPMRTTVALDDDLVRIAQEFTGVVEKTALIREALKALIERESARRLASLGGTMPSLKSIPRRRVRPH